jgi:DNA primase
LKLIAPRWAKKIVLALDSDAAGQNATLRSLEVARQTLQADYTGRLSVDMRVLQIPDAKDPDDLIRETPERWSALVNDAKPVADYVIDVEVNALPSHASLQEREAVARRLLPMLLASENNLYTKDNLQRLALRLRIAERDLLAWADEQEQIDRAKAPYKPSAASTSASHAADTRHADEPPDMPPLDYEDYAPPPDVGEYAPSEPPSASVVMRKPGPARDVPAERHILRLLFQNTAGYYEVNRKLRELAGTNRALLDGALSDWGTEDFSHSDYRALMGAFVAAMGQDDMEPLDYLRAQAGAFLQTQLDAIMMDELNTVRAQLRGTRLADLDMIWNQTRRGGDMNAELIEKALRLRIQRLQREREELCFLQIDAHSSGDADAEMLFQHQIILSSTAKGLIEAELQKKLSLLRE